MSRPLFLGVVFFLFLCQMCVCHVSVAENSLPYVTAVPIQKANVSQFISRKADLSGDNLVMVELDRTMLKDKQVNENVDLVHIGFDTRDLIKGKIVKQFISKTVQMVLIKPLQALTGTGVIQANLNVESTQDAFKVPLTALRRAQGLSGIIYIVDPLTYVVTQYTVTVMGFDGADILVRGMGVSDTGWVVVSGFHKVVSGRKVRIFSKSAE